MFDSFTAADARKAVAVKRTTKPEIDSLMNLIHEKICWAAKRGEISVIEPLKGLRTTVDDEQVDAVAEALIIEGYDIWVSHPNVLRKVSWEEPTP